MSEMFMVYYWGTKPVYVLYISSILEALSYFLSNFLSY